MTTRRAFVTQAGIAGTALVVGVRAEWAASPAPPHGFRPNRWLAVDADGRVTVTFAGAEMGQGIRTALPMIVADELEVEWSAVRVVPAEFGPEFPRLPSTGGSDSVSDGWSELRKAGAAAREMLIAAAADAWRVPAADCAADRGAVVHRPSGRRTPYGSLVTAAAARPVPADPALKPASAFRLVGQRVKRFDGPQIVTGAAVYGLDVRVPGMRVATVLRSPVIDGRAAHWSDAAARAVEGVRGVFAVSTGIAVVADDTWSALKARDRLEVTWDEGPHRDFDSDAFRRRLRDAADEEGVASRNDGDAVAALSRAARRIEAIYEYPFQAHATIEPMNATARVDGRRCELWVPTQAPGRVRADVAQKLGLRPEDVLVHTPLLGGGFGRRLAVDYAVEAAEVAQKAGEPVQVVWTRTDDLRHGHYHPASAHRMRGAIDERGRPVAWFHRTAGSLLSLYPAKPEQLRDPEYLRDSMWGAYDVPYDVPNVRTEYRYVESPVRSGPWRAVFSPPCTFARESFLDELAALAGLDPLRYRLELLGGEPMFKVGMLTIDRERYRRVLELAAEKAGWGRPLSASGGRRHGRGIAGNVYHGMTYVAQVAEVSVGSQGDLRVHRVVCAIDAGLAVNPLGLEAQVESGILFGLSAALYGEIAFKAGRVQQSSYRDYPVVRLREAPAVEVHIVAGADQPFGVGEPPVPPTAPAVFNAVFAATGRRIRRLPLAAQELATEPAAPAP
jgi:isoquinoline 1-oxidoreductase beta subunit